jgi:hypothetical protein
LARIVPTFDVSLLSAMHKNVQEFLSEWNDVLVAFRDYMPQHPCFVELAATQTRLLQAEIDMLETKRIFEWNSPTIGGSGMILSASKLQKAQNSFVYRYLLHIQYKNETNIEINPNFAEAVGQWTESLEKSTNDLIAATK